MRKITLSISISLIIIIVFGCKDTVRLNNVTNSKIDNSVKVVDTNEVAVNIEDFEFNLERRFLELENLEDEKKSSRVKQPQIVEENPQPKSNKQNTRLNKKTTSNQTKKNESVTYLSPLEKKKVKLEKEIQALEKVKNFYFNIHTLSIEKKFRRAIYYTDLNDKDYEMKFSRSGNKDEHLQIYGKCYLQVSDLKDSKSNKYIDLVQSFTKALMDYCLVVSLEQNKKISLNNYTPFLQIKIELADKPKKFKLKYKEGIKQTLGAEYKLNDKIVTSSLVVDESIRFNDIGYLIGQNAFSELILHFNKFNGFDYIEVYKSQKKVTTFFVYLEIQNFFLKDYSKHIQDSIYACNQIKVLEDSIKLLDLQNH